MTHLRLLAALWAITFIFAIAGCSPALNLAI